MKRDKHSKRSIYVVMFMIILSSNCLYSQSRLVLNNDPWIVMNNNAYIVLGNSNANAITLAGSGGRIVSEAENNKIRWNIGTSTGTYTLPFADNLAEGGTKIPLSLTIGTSGTGAGYIDFSTYDGATWNNALYMPSMVTHMGQYLSPNAPNNSQKAIDRFWLLNAQGYVTKPAPGSMVFTYIDNEHTAGGNSITESVLGAQRFNNGTNQWGDMLPIGLVNTFSNTVTTPAISAANFFAAWTLSDSNDPLPISLLSFNANCENSNIVLKWTTASEQNNHYFTVMKSFDGYTFAPIGTVLGNGNSNTIRNYLFVDKAYQEKAYYRLSQTDFDGKTTSYDLVLVSCEEYLPLDIISVNYNSNQQVFAYLQIPTNGNYTINMYDLKGSLLFEKTLYLQKGVLPLPLDICKISDGVYFFSVQNDFQKLSKKFFLNR